MSANAHIRLGKDTFGAVRGSPLVLLHLEGAVMLAVAAIAYGWLAPMVGWGWGRFALLFLVPDLSMLGYLAGPRIGAAGYNAGHSYVTPALLAGSGMALGVSLAPVVALIWVAHVGFDRMMGYGLKYRSGFGDTHLGRKGRAVTPLPVAD